MVPSNGTSLPSSQPPKLFHDTYRSMYGLFQRGYMTLDSRLWNISRVIGGYSPNVGDVNMNSWVLLGEANTSWGASRSIHGLASLTRLYYDALGVSRNTNSSEMKKKAFNGASSKDTYELFEKWCKEHGKTYSSAEEKRYRFEVFQESYARVTRHNQMGNSSYTAGLNYFSDRKNHEVPRGHLSEEHMNALDSVNRNANSSEMKKKAYDGASSKDTYELFEKWCKEHGKTYC